MKKFLLKIMIFFVAIAIIDIIFGKCCDYMYEHSHSGDTGKINYALRECNADVLIMGSSRANHHYNPQILSDSLGMTVYNLGIDGSGVILMDGFYRLIVQRYVPQFIIYELTPSFDFLQYAGDANNTRYLSQLKPYYNNESISCLFDDVDSSERTKLFSGLYRYNTSFFNLVKFYLSGDCLTGNGYNPLNGVMKDYTQFGGNAEIAIDTLKIKYLHQFIHDCKKHGTRLIFTISPSYGAKSSSNYLPGIQVCNEEGYGVLDYFCDTTFVLNKEYFKDSYHLNSKGADVFSMKVAHSVKRLLNN